MVGIALKILIAKKYAKSRDNIIKFFKNNIIIIYNNNNVLRPFLSCYYAYVFDISKNVPSKYNTLTCGTTHFLWEMVRFCEMSLVL